MADVCDIGLQTAVEEVVNSLNKYMKEHASNYRGKATGIIQNKLKENLKALGNAVQHNTHPPEEISRLTQRAIHDARLDFNALVSIEKRAEFLFNDKWAKKGFNLRTIKSRVLEPLQKISNIVEKSNKAFENRVDDLIDNMKQGGKHVTPEQAEASKKLMVNILEEGDQAAKKYLTDKGEVGDFDEIILKGLKEGHITGKGNLTELDMVFRTIKQLEDSVQDELEKTVLGYKRLKGHGFVASVDKIKANNMSADQFVEQFRDANGKFYVKFDNVDDVSDEAMAGLLRGYHGELVEAKRGRFIRGLSAVGGTLKDRHFTFTSLEGEKLFFKRLKGDKEGLLRSRFKHLQSQLREAALRRDIGSDPDQWYSHFYNSVQTQLRGRFDGLDKVEGMFEGLANSMEHALGRSNYQSENAAILTQILHDATHALLTPFSGSRNFLHDGTMHSAIVQRSFDPNFGVLTGSLRHLGQLIDFSLKQGFDKEDFKAVAKLMEQEGITILMSRAAAARRLYAPEITEFTDTADGLYKWFSDRARNSADRVSYWTLADASHIGGRFKGALTAGQLVKAFTKTDLNDGAKSFLNQMGYSLDDWKIISENAKWLSHHDYGDLLMDSRATIASLSDDYIKGQKIGAETLAETRSRLLDKLQNMQISLVDELATRPTLRTGIGVVPAGKSDLQNSLISLIFKFKGMALTAQQSMNRSVRRINNADPWETGIWGTGITNVGDLLRGAVHKDRVATNMSIMTGLAASGYMISAARDILNGKTPGEFGTDDVFESVANTGIVGLPMDVAYSVIYQKDVVGTPLAKPVRKGLKLVSSIDDALKGDMDPLKVASYELLKIAVPETSIVLRDNSVWDAAVRDFLDLPLDSYRRSLSREGQDELFDF